MTRLLIDNKANVSVRNIFNETALHFAAENGKYNFMKQYLMWELNITSADWLFANAFDSKLFRSLGGRQPAGR